MYNSLEVIAIALTVLGMIGALLGWQGKKIAETAKGNAIKDKAIEQLESNSEKLNKSIDDLSSAIKEFSKVSNELMMSIVKLETEIVGILRDNDKTEEKIKDLYSKINRMK